MANLCYNKVIITHDDITKVQDLYRIPADDFFNYILPPPVELCNEETLRHKQYNLKEFGTDNLYDWIKKNWTVLGQPTEFHISTLSKHNRTLLLAFDTRWSPPIGIYDELLRQGYFVRAYFHSWESWYCGSYIYGVGDWFDFVDIDNLDDVPLDIDRMFNVKASAKEIHDARMEDVYDVCSVYADYISNNNKEDVVEKPDLSPQRHTAKTLYFRDIIDEISC